MARRATPPALLAVRAAVAAALPASGLVLVACSGGADSLALAGALALEAPGRAGLISVDHGLQPHSKELAEGVAKTGAGLGLAPSEAVSVVVGAAGGPEAAARDARLGVLQDLAGRYDASAVLLAHTLDDQAEQVLLGLARGAGTRTLAGMPRERGILRRPLLDLPRAVVRQACLDLGLTPWEDPHNADPAFARARVRHRLLPVLERELGPGIAAALARSAGQLAADAAALDDLAGAALTSTHGDLLVDVLLDLAPAIRRRVLRLAALAAGATEVSQGQTLSLEALVCAWRGQGEVSLPGGIRCHRREGRLSFVRG